MMFLKLNACSDSRMNSSLLSIALPKWYIVLIPHNWSYSRQSIGHIPTNIIGPSLTNLHWLLHDLDILTNNLVKLTNICWLLF